jgi:hypothetical protein
VSGQLRRIFSNGVFTHCPRNNGGVLICPEFQHELQPHAMCRGLAGHECCRMVVDQQTHRLHHFQHFDFFKYQMSFAESQVTLDAFNDPKIEYAGKVALHNLDYYRQFSIRLANAMKYKQMENMLTDMIGPASVQQIQDAIPDIFE